MSLRPAWSTRAISRTARTVTQRNTVLKNQKKEIFPGQLGLLHRETLSHKKRENRKRKKKERRKEKEKRKSCLLNPTDAADA